MEVREGTILRIDGHFVHFEPPNMRFPYQTPNNMVLITAVVGFVGKNDQKDLDIDEVMRSLGWQRIEEDEEENQTT